MLVTLTVKDLEENWLVNACPGCGAEFMFRRSLVAAKKGRNIYCPNGHSMHTSDVEE